LLLLWKGIGTFLARNPGYSKLFGPVSISNEYSRASRELMIHWLSRHACDREAADSATAQRPVHCGKLLSSAVAVENTIAVASLDELSAIISDIEGDGRGPCFYANTCASEGR
jgi:hypothetical protein